MGGFVLVATYFYIHAMRRRDADVNVLGETVDDPKAFGQRRATLQLELKALALQAPQAMHDPVVFFDQHGVESALAGDHREQLVKVATFMQKLCHCTTPDSACVSPCWRSC